MGISTADFERIKGKFEQMVADRATLADATAERIRRDAILADASAAANAARLEETTDNHTVTVDELDLKHEFDSLVPEPDPEPAPEAALHRKPGDIPM